MKNIKLFLLSSMMAIVSGALLVTIPWLLIVNGNSINVALYIGLYATSCIIFQPLCGSIADAYRNKPILIIINLIKAIAILLIILMNIKNAYIHIVAPLLIGASDAQFRALMGKFLDDYAKTFSQQIDQHKFNARFFAFREGGYVLGTICAGYLISVIGQQNTLFFLFLLCLTSIFIASSISLTDTRKNSFKNYLSEIFCASYILKHKSLCDTILISSLVSFPLRLAPVFAAPLVYDYLKGTALLLGNMELFWAIGAICADTIISKYYKHNYDYHLKYLSIIILLFSFGALFYATSTTVLVIYYMIGFFGQSLILYFNDIQGQTCSDKLGRVFSSYNLLATFPVIIYTMLVNLFSFDNYLVAIVLCLVSLFISLLLTVIMKNQKYKEAEYESRH